MNVRLVLAFILALSITACSSSTLVGSGNVIGQEFNLDGFRSIDVCCGMELYVQIADTYAIRIEADDNILEAMDVRVNGGTLVVDFGASLGILDVQETQPMQVFVNLPELSGVEVSGGGLVSTVPVETNRFTLNLSGGSEAYMQGLQANDVTIESSGGGNLDLRGLQVGDLVFSLSGGGDAALYGSADELEVDLSGGSELNGQYLQTISADITISGGGRSSIAVSEELRADLGGGSRLDYYGTPDIPRQQTSGDSQLFGHAVP